MALQTRNAETKAMKTLRVTKKIKTALLAAVLMTGIALAAYAAENPPPQFGCDPYACATFGAMCSCNK